MDDKFLRRLRGAVRFNVSRTRDQLSIDRPDPSRDQAGVLQVTNPDRAIETLCDEIDEAITVRGINFELRMASCHFREQGSEVSRAERDRHRNSQATAQVTSGQDCFPGRFNLGAGSGCVVSERGSRFRERGTAGGSRKKLDAKVRFKPGEPPADDRLGDAKPLRGGRNATSIGNVHERPQLFDIQSCVPHSATQLDTRKHYLIAGRNGITGLQATLPSTHIARQTGINYSQRQQRIVMTFRNGLKSLLRPEDSVLVLIDHQPYQLANLNSHDPHIVVNNSTALAKAAKVFGVPTILTSVVADRGGLIFQQITDVFPGQEVIDRTFINTWEDRKVVDAVKATGRKQLIIAGLWTEICVAMPVIQALGEGWDVTVITDASGAVSVEAHEVAIQRMIAAGANMMTWMALAAEWQRDWARIETARALNEVVKQHAAGSGIAYLWEQQLLNTPVPSAAA